MSRDAIEDVLCHRVHPESAPTANPPVISSVPDIESKIEEYWRATPGLSLRGVARVFDVHHSRVGQIILDAAKEGRLEPPTFDRKGERGPRAKLTEQGVVSILDRLHQGEKGRELASEFGVSESAISSLRKGQTWTHIPRPWDEVK